MGRDLDKRYNAGAARPDHHRTSQPSFVVPQRLPLADALDAFRRFDRRENGYVKVILDPATGAAAGRVDNYDVASQT
jgi:hypothetical protein